MFYGTYIAFCHVVFLPVLGTHNVVLQCATVSMHGFLFLIIIV